MLPKLLAKMRIGKTNGTSSNQRQGYLCGKSRNFSDDEDDDFMNLGCLNRYNSAKNSNKTGSMQALDKVSTDKKDSGMKPAMSMIDLNAKKPNILKTSRKKPIFTKGEEKTDYESISKEQKKDLKKKHKDDRLKRGYSWRQAYKTGAIPLEKNKDNKTVAKDLKEGPKEGRKDQSNNQRGSRNDIFIYDNSSNSSSQNSGTSRSESTKSRDSKNTSVVNRYSSTLQIFQRPENTSKNHSSDRFNKSTEKCNKSYDKPDGPRYSKQILSNVKSLESRLEADMSTQVPPASTLSSSSSSSSTLSSVETKPPDSTDRANNHTSHSLKIPKAKTEKTRSVLFTTENNKNNANDIIGGLKALGNIPTYSTERKGSLKQTTIQASPIHLAKSNPHISSHHTPDRMASADNLSKKNKIKKDEARLKLLPRLKTTKENDQRVYDSISKTSYFKGSLLGKGGFARCYEMVDVKTKKKYAGKIISKNILNKGNQMEKIKKEIELHRSLSHKHVVAFHSCFEDPSNVIIVLEYCSMKSLVHMLKRRKYLTEPEVRHFMAQLVNGVQYIHSRKVIHRDLKLGNMLLNSLMHLKIADFGLASKVNYTGEKKIDVCGTPNYISPEVLQKRGHSYEADIWALGCIMYALLCGRPPFETTTLKETYLRITMRKYSTPPHVSNTARNLIKSLLSLEPLHRPALEKITKHSFFFDGFFPLELSPSTCEIQPKFPLVAIDKVALNHINPETAALAHTKHTRKSASQVIARVKATEYESHDLNSNLKDDYLVGSAPTIPKIFDACTPAKHPTYSQLYLALKPHINTLLSRISDPLPDGAITSSNQAHTRHNRYVCVTKWIDYSDKYGFSYQLSNGSVGVLFNDKTKMLLLNDNRTVIVEEGNEDRISFKHTNTPPQHTKKTNLLMFFAQFMENNLISGGSGHNSSTDKEVFLRHWFRTSSAIVMCLSDATVQVNFIEDHTKIVFSLSDEVWVTLVDSKRRPATYPLKSLPSMGCHGEVVRRLQYASEMVARVVEENGGGRRNSKEADL